MIFGECLCWTVYYIPWIYTRHTQAQHSLAHTHTHTCTYASTSTSRTKEITAKIRFASNNNKKSHEKSIWYKMKQSTSRMNVRRSVLLMYSLIINGSLPYSMAWYLYCCAADTRHWWKICYCVFFTQAKLYV